MTGIKVTVKPPLRVVARRLEKSRKELINLKVFYKKGSILLDQWVQKNFQTEGKGLGADSWQPFKLGGRKIEGVLDTSAKLLQNTGRLRASHLPFATKDNAGIGSDLPYSETHQEGLGFVPQRRTLPEDTDVKIALTALLNQHLKKVVDNHAKG